MPSAHLVFEFFFILLFQMNYRHQCLVLLYQCFSSPARQVLEDIYLLKFQLNTMVCKLKCEIFKPYSNLKKNITLCFCLVNTGDGLRIHFHHLYSFHKCLKRLLMGQIMQDNYTAKRKQLKTKPMLACVASMTQQAKTSRRGLQAHSITFS